MSDTLTILGNVATDPTQSRTPSGIPVTNFRVATTHRRIDPATQTWVDVSTNWYSVAAFRQLGEHAKASLRCGDSVIITGRLKIRTWESNGKSGTSIDIDADAIGHDLRRGTTAFLRASRAAGTETPSRTVGEDHRDTDADAVDEHTSSDEEAMTLDTSWSIVPSDAEAEPVAGATY
jgi:single-strand DNA-binding protein